MPYFGETRTDCIMFRASWADRFYGIGLDKYDLKQKAHEDAVGCGHAIMFFEVRIRPMPAVEGQIHRLVFVFWTTTWGSEGALHGHRGNIDRGGSP